MKTAELGAAVFAAAEPEVAGFKKTKQNCPMKTLQRAVSLVVGTFLVLKTSALGAEPGDPISIVAGQTLSGSLTEGDITLVTYLGEGGEQIGAHYALVEGAGGSPAISITDPAGNLVASGWAVVSSAVGLGWVTLTNTGSYTITLGGAVGNFRLSVMSNTRANVADEGEQGAIVAGQTLTATMAEGEVDMVDYVGRGGEQLGLRFAFVQGGGGSPSITLTDPLGNLVASAWSPASDAVGLGLTTLTNAGTYRILLSGGVGRYRLTAISNPGPNLVDEGDAGSLIAGQTVSGSMIEGEADVVNYVGRAGDFLGAVFAFVGDGGGTPTISITDPQGALVAFNWSAASNVTGTEGTLTNAGTYQIHLSGGVGDYRLTIISNPGPNPGDEDTSPIISGTALAPTMTPGDVDVFYFDAIAGDRVSVEVSSLGMPNVSLYGPSGLVQNTWAVFSDAIGFVTDCLPDSGRYIIVARGEPSATPYQVRIAQSPGPIPPEFPDNYLQVLQCGDVVSVRWRATAVGYILQKASALPAGATVTWIDVQGPYVPTADYVGASFQASDGEQYFRLFKAE